jgi:hypothetical protein
MASVCGLLRRIKITRKLEQLLNLPTSVSDSEELTHEETQQIIEDNKDIIIEMDATISKIDAALPLVRDLEAGDAELDELATLAKAKAEDLMDLGMNIDPRFAGVIMQTAGTMLGHAITAKTAKMDKKLRMINLQLQKARLDHQIKKDTKNSDDAEETIDGKGIVLDRNELLRSILNQNKDK